ncbi:IucA/IucC family siderophore biosynthesis protein [Streptomyces sp. NPDC088194]|uniref:IucA/IucC family protein n=1 Tax=Streptomyces sp. NPDC088194 TaxID=3154931 RepID=UPI00344FEF8A
MTTSVRSGLEPALDPATAHLNPELWARATRHLVRKALAEFAHEKLLTPARDEERGSGWYTVRSDDGGTAYRFRADRLALDHWHLDPASLTRTRESAQSPAAPDPIGEDMPLDALAFFAEFRASLALGDDVLPLYLEEITSTLASLAYKYGKHTGDGTTAGPGTPGADGTRHAPGAPATPATPSAAALSRAPFQTVEAAMLEGHPCFVANSGRIGFGAHDLAVYTPEAATPVRLTWLAAHRDRARFSVGAGLSYDDLIAGELDASTRERFARTLRDLGLDPADYLLIPAHPWQWEHRLATTFAGEVAQRHLVHLGPGDDTHLAQQSVRTFFNADHPERHYVKTALSVLNMGFLRGLSAAYMAGTPAINDWVADLVAADPTLTAARFSILRERAAVGYHPLPYEAATEPGSPYRKMLAALWRESPVPGLGPGRSAATMASLLHVDPDGGSFAAALIARSGEPPERWLRGYLDAYLVPVVHCMYAHRLAFMPHGENVILVLDADGRVERVVFKDIAEEIVVMDPKADLPPEVRRVRADIPDDEQALCVFTDVFDCFLRFLSAILHTGRVLDQDAFWRTVAECVADYQRAHPELAGRFRRHDLFAPSFARSCLNRLQLRNNRSMVDLADPSAALQFVGILDNPLAAHPFGPH